MQLEEKGIQQWQPRSHSIKIDEAALEGLAAVVIRGLVSSF